MTNPSIPTTMPTGSMIIVPQSAAPDAMLEALNNLELYLHADDVMPPLIRCGLLHYQFETIHPFNG